MEIFDSHTAGLGYNFQRTTGIRPVGGSIPRDETCSGINTATEDEVRRIRPQISRANRIGVSGCEGVLMRPELSLCAGRFWKVASTEYLLPISNALPQYLRFGS